MESLHVLVTALLKLHHNWKIELMVNWDTIVGDIGQHICLEKITEDSTLIIGVHDTRWMQELHYLSHELIDLINRSLGGSSVKAVRFVLSRRLKIDHKPARKTTSQQRSVQRIVRIPVSLNSRQIGALQNISDGELRDSLRNLMQMSS
jgi:hypothetical protein